MSRPFGVLATGAVALAFASLTTASAQSKSTPLGYYRFPAVHDTTIVFTAEGDIWTVGLGGGVARRLTSGRGEESNAAISPDGATIAFTGEYEGPDEVYTMPISGGLPVRHTWDGSFDAVVGWTPDGHVLYSTRTFSTLPIQQLVSLDTASGVRTHVPLEQAADGAYDGATLFFTRFGFQGSHTRRYKGGTAQQLWKWSSAMPEAVPLTSDYAGTSKTPMPWNGRIYFASDRDGVMNIWSVDEDGHDARQITHHTDYDVQSPSLSSGRIVYQLGADLWMLDIKSGQDRVIPIRLASDFDQMREEWVDTAMKWVSGVHLSPTGDRVVLTARGQVFVAPVKADQGRLVEAARHAGVRYRDARFMPDGDTLLALSDESGEVELWTLPADGVGGARQLTRDGSVLRWEAVPAPNGKLIAHTDKDQRIWVYDAASGTSKRIGTSDYGDFSNLAWSPDSRWLAYQVNSPNGLWRIYVYDTRSGATTAVTSDRYDSFSPAWSPDGKWLWFLSDRHFRSSVGSPWGSRAPEPFFDRQSEIFALALHKNERFPFAHADELHPDTSESPKKSAARPGAAKSTQAPSPDSSTTVTIDTTGIADRLYQVPVPSGNYSALNTDGSRLYFLSAEPGGPRRATLHALPITRVDPKIGNLLENITGYELSANRKKILVRRGDDLFVFDAGTHTPEKLTDNQVDLSGWKLHVDPREEWQQMYREAWRLERDYFYDRNMNGIDWPAIRKKYAPLADRVTDRAELSDVFSQMIAELSALHMFVYGGDEQTPTLQIETAALGAEFARDAGAGGYRVVHVYRNDPDDPDALSPLARPGVDVHNGDVIVDVNGTPTLSGPSLGALLRNTAGTQVRLRVKTGAATRDVIVEPMTSREAANLRYDEWEYTRRMMVDSLSHGRIGYLHLRAMGPNDIAQFERDFYPVYNRDALIVDVRNNGGGNIDSWILEKLMRRSWMFWQPRIGTPYWNMQEAFRGPMTVMVNEHTASDGEAFAYGFRSLGLGKVVGTRTWGGEIWLSSSNVLVDRGIATAAELGVYGPNSEWLIEGHGVDPDLVVDDTPHQTFLGHDAQLEAAVKLLMDDLAKEPPSVPKPPKYPHKGP
jgi:tricorn protease